MILSAPNDVAAPRCGNCRHFDADARSIEAAFPGLTAMGSAFASTRSRDGLCLRHERYVADAKYCVAHVPRGR